ncbi:MAG: hypothetical protein MHM6MM_002908 [Cercozoa sp. M6MM]
MFTRAARLARSCARQVSITTVSQEQAAATLAKAAKRRPISPHVTIYKFPHTAIASIAFRIAGVALAGAFSLGLVLNVMEYDTIDIATQVGQWSPLRFLLLFGFTYHSYAGLRHMFWESMPMSLKNHKLVAQRSIPAAIIPAVLALALTYMWRPGKPLVSSKHPEGTFLPIKAE